ncbi:Porphobilinogen deaminase, C-terminal [Pseudocohnilembus persalinus]|uniref:hydroxymethylbilane synthase n=1 Tax=Pseudocohnilembus persalinus TaxID=266149 RepID=A0A0V0QK10_PSEPJ|nr:Porphobilinogen deaminase, C-terminal [Pseudocohnilembus persalinus]|eukprot:KRX02637.1 Porphobilinogen deaminase, C-terminal [Pseudocohnilembus persalinus]
MEILAQENQNYKKVDQEFLKNIQNRKFRISTRDSALALSQVYEVIELLVNVKELGLNKDNFEVVPVKNAEGDQNLKDPLYKMGGQGVFTKQIEDEILNKNCDIAVHSLKDLPTIVHQDLIVAAVPKLQYRDDVIIFKNLKQGKLEDLKEGAMIGTSSLRRITNLKNRYPSFKFQNIRGNLQKRFQKLQEQDYDAMVLAKAGLDRLNLNDKIGCVLEAKEFLYAPSQGALGVQCRKEDQQLFRMLQFIQDDYARIRTDMERQFLNKLEGGCKLPIATYTEIQGDQMLIIGQVWNMDGSKTVREEITGSIADRELGLKLSNKMKEKGAYQILQEIIKQMEDEQK